MKHRTNALHISCPGDLPSAAPSEGWTLAVGCDRAQREPSGRCPSCGRSASVETWDSWRPGEGWRRVRALRCRAPGKSTSRGACGAVHVEAEDAIELDEQPNERRPMT